MVSFLEKDDNSIVMPRKEDFGGVFKQKRIFKRYLQNLYLKFISENFNIKYCFCRMHSTHFSLVNYTSSNAYVRNIRILP